MSKLSSSLPSSQRYRRSLSSTCTYTTPNYLENKFHCLGLQLKHQPERPSKNHPCFATFRRTNITHAPVTLPSWIMTFLKLFRPRQVMRKHPSFSSSSAPPPPSYNTTPKKMSKTRKLFYTSSYLFFYTHCPSERSFDAIKELRPQLLAEVGHGFNNLVDGVTNPKEVNNNNGTGSLLEVAKGISGGLWEESLLPGHRPSDNDDGVRMMPISEWPLSPWSLFPSFGDTLYILAVWIVGSIWDGSWFPPHWKPHEKATPPKGSKSEKMQLTVPTKGFPRFEKQKKSIYSYTKNLV